MCVIKLNRAQLSHHTIPHYTALYMLTQLFHHVRDSFNIVYDLLLPGNRALLSFTCAEFSAAFPNKNMSAALSQIVGAKYNPALHQWEKESNILNMKVAAATAAYYHNIAFITEYMSCASSDPSSLIGYAVAGQSIYGEPLPDNGFGSVLSILIATIASTIYTRGNPPLDITRIILANAAAYGNMPIITRILTQGRHFNDDGTRKMTVHVK